ncbi:MAG: polysaccharide biosynthesis C-terminal domain-containing protein, partial [Nitrososphaerota archaeon]|nr:polysaccharide biosynthesis C-terminal domain-containing protein [Nitrososphaerota archaeon]
LPLASAVYGRAYTFAGSFLLILVIPYLFAGIGSLAQIAFLNGVGETRKTLVVGLAGSMVTFIFGAILAPIFSVYGVLAASVVGNAVSYLVGAKMVNGILGKTGMTSRTWRVYIVSAVAALLTYPVVYLPLHPIVILVIGAVVYFALLVPLLSASGAVNNADVEEIEGFFSEMGAASKLFHFVVMYYGLFRRNRHKGSPVDRDEQAEKGD